VKPRPVVVTLEIVTDAPLRELRSTHAWREHLEWRQSFGAVLLHVEQAQANVIHVHPNLRAWLATGAKADAAAAAVARRNGPKP
jgi:hypothetical protein